MKKLLTKDPAWFIMLMAVLTLVALNFVNDEQKRNLFAGSILLAIFVLFLVSILLRSLPYRSKIKL